MLMNLRNLRKIVNERNIIKLFLDVGSVVLSFFFGFWFKYNSDWTYYLETSYVFIYLSVFLFVYFYIKMYSKSWSYSSILDIMYIMMMNMVASLSVAVYATVSTDIDYFKYVFALVALFSATIQLFLRYMFRIKHYFIRYNKQPKEKKIIIYGAGEAGINLAREYRNNKELNYEILGFIDDDHKKRKTSFHNIEVLGGKKVLKDLLQADYIDEIIVAIPSADSKHIIDIVNELKNVRNIDIKILPDIKDILGGKSLSQQVRSVRIEDLLGRKQVDINCEIARVLIEGRVIFITGGAGSIGSELSRQVASYNPSMIVNIDINENAIYFLELELKRNYPDLKMISEICNMRDKVKLEQLFAYYRPHIVFHAAAHKHVPLMEHNPEESIKNNIFGTRNVAVCSDKYGVYKFILVSTDKAVNPTNVMGATKRACELLVSNINKKSRTKFMVVRFGNVLGSDGSVVKIFSKLIEEGKNLTVTHKDVTRYFMTISEAVQLIIEAGVIGNGGEIFILDMGESVKIYDLAKSMIRLSNANLDVDIVGLRPGEKLFEELLYDVNASTKTCNKKIYISNAEFNNSEDFDEKIDYLYSVVNSYDKLSLKKLMAEIVTSYKIQDN